MLTRYSFYLYYHLAQIMAFQFPILENFLNVEVEESQAVEVMKSENANGIFPTEFESAKEPLRVVM